MDVRTILDDRVHYLVREKNLMHGRSAAAGFDLFEEKSGGEADDTEQGEEAEVIDVG